MHDLLGLALPGRQATRPPRLQHIYNNRHALSPFAGLAFHPVDGILQVCGVVRGGVVLVRVRAAAPCCDMLQEDDASCTTACVPRSTGSAIQRL
jgi:hypothetical protein